MRRVLSAVALGALTVAATVLGTSAPAHASIPSPTACDTMPLRVTVLSTPLLVQVGLTQAAPNWEHAVVCVGTNGGATHGVAYQQYELRVHPYGWLGPAACNPGGVGDQYTGVGTGFSTAPGTIGVNAGGGVATSPQVCVSGTTFRVHLPVLLCVGGGCPLNTATGVGTTGVVVGTFGLTGGPAGTTGAGLALSSTYLFVNGITVPIGPGTYAAGTTVPNAGVGTAGVVACGPLNLVCVPGSAGVFYTGGPVIGVSAGPLGTVYQGVPLGYTCVPLFRVTPAPNPC